MSFLSLRSPRFSNVLDGPAIIISTQAVTAVGSSTATANGTLTNSGNSTITAMGFVWATHSSPTLADNVVTVSNTLGAYTGSLTGLPGSTQIFVDAYATNAAGTVYGGDQNFTTNAPVAGAVASTLLMLMVG